MDALIDLGAEVLVDRSRLRNPYLRLLAAAAGQKLASGSPWVALDKRALTTCSAGRRWSPRGRSQRVPQVRGVARQ